MAVTFDIRKKYKEYAYKYTEKITKLQQRHHTASEALPDMYSPKEFAEQYKQAMETLKALPTKNTNYMRTVLSAQFKGMSSAQQEAVLNWQEKQIQKFIDEEGVSYSQAVKIFKQNDYYLTKSDVKYMTDKYIRREHEISEYYRLLKAAGKSTSEAAHMIGVLYFGSV